MATFSAETWVLMGGVAGICLLAFLYALATLYRDQTMLHDLKVRVHELRRDYVERIARQQAEREEAESEAVRPSATSPTPKSAVPPVAGVIGPSTAKAAA